MAKRFEIYLLEIHIKLILEAVLYYINNNFKERNSSMSEEQISKYTLFRDVYEIIENEYLNQKNQSKNKGISDIRKNIFKKFA